jgi:hypothetical protein
MLAEEIAKDPQLAGMKAFQIYLKFMNSFSKTPQSVGGVYIDPSVHYSPITI